MAGAVPSWSGWATYQLGIWFLALRRVEVKKDPGPGLERGGGGGRGPSLGRFLVKVPLVCLPLLLLVFFFFLETDHQFNFHNYLSKLERTFPFCLSRKKILEKLNNLFKQIILLTFNNQNFNPCFI